MKKPKVFICYVKQDQRKAMGLFFRLLAAGADPWMDKRKLELGDDWEHEITKAVAEADAFVVCLRPGFDETGFRQKEVRLALDALDKRPPGRGFIIPFIVDPCNLPDWCETIHAGTDLTKPTKFEDLLRAIEKHCGVELKAKTDSQAPTVRTAPSSRAHGVELKSDKDSQVSPLVAHSSISGSSIEDWAREHQFEFPTAEKVQWLTRVLHAITTTPMGGDFALMGGSAIVFLNREMYRFSTDLDLDFVGNRNLGRTGEREVDKRLKQDRATLARIARDLGMTFKIRSNPQNRFAQYELTYPSAYTRKGTVELDISYRFGHSVLGTVTRPWPITVAGVPSEFKVTTVKEEELYASKVIAMVEAKERLDFPSHIGLLTKRKIRHLFDVYLLAREVLNGKTTLNLAQFRDFVLLFGMSRIGGFEYFRGNAIGSYTEADVKSELRSVVPRDFPVPAVEEMKWTVRKFLDCHAFNYTEREHRFMEDFRGGRFRPEDLFGSGDTARRLRDTQYYREILGKVRLLVQGGSSRRKKTTGNRRP